MCSEEMLRGRQSIYTCLMLNTEIYEMSKFLCSGSAGKAGASRLLNVRAIYYYSILVETHFKLTQ